MHVGDMGCIEQTGCDKQGVITHQETLIIHQTEGFFHKNLVPLPVVCTTYNRKVNPLLFREHLLCKQNLLSGGRKLFF